MGKARTIGKLRSAIRQLKAARRNLRKGPEKLRPLAPSKATIHKAERELRRKEKQRQK